jgi:hypothetical protein
MTDCSQLPAELENAQQERAAMPNPIPYCQANSDNYQDFKTCLRDVRGQVLALDGQILDLSNNIEICNALIGTWTMHATSEFYDGIQFTITTWDTQGPLTMTITYTTGRSSPVISPEYVTAPSPHPELTFEITDTLGAPGYYTARLDRSAPLPQFINGQIFSLEDPNDAFAEWTATISLL